MQFQVALRKEVRVVKLVEEEAGKVAEEDREEVVEGVAEGAEGRAKEEVLVCVI